MKILHYGLSNHLGGIETYLFNLVKNIDLYKYQNDFLIFGNEKPCFYDDLRNLGCKFFFITKRKENYFKEKKELKEILIKNKYDILHCHCNTLSFIDPIIIASKLKIDTRIIIHSRNGGAKISIHSKVFHYINKRRIPYSKMFLLAVSTEAGKWMFNDKEFTVINNGVDTYKYKYNEVSRNKLRKELFLQDKIIIILTGALRKQKNHKFAFDILKELLKYDDEYFMILLGEGVLEKELNSYAIQIGVDKHLMFLHNKKNVSDYLSASDIFLFPSFYEGFPNALLEAETNGLKIFASDTITKEVAVDNYIKYLNINDNAELWAKSIYEDNRIIDRKNAFKNIKENRKDKKSEIVALIDFYEKISYGKI